MALPNTIQQREYKKFIDAGNGETAVRIAGSFLSDIVFDAIDVGYPSATVETYEYYTGGLAGTLVATITVTYTDATKELIQSVVRT